MYIPGHSVDRPPPQRRCRGRRSRGVTRHL